MRAAPRQALAAAVLVACLGVAAGCGGGGGSAASTFPGAPAPGALDAFWRSPASAGFTQFTRSPGGTTCVVFRGGPETVALPGHCTTAALGVTGGSEIRLTERWSAEDFHGGGSPATGELSHTWVFSVSPSGAVRQLPGEGDFPPEFVK